jgi:hypothetical protein
MAPRHGTTIRHHHHHNHHAVVSSRPRCCIGHANVSAMPSFPPHCRLVSATPSPWIRHECPAFANRHSATAVTSPSPTVSARAVLSPPTESPVVALFASNSTDRCRYTRLIARSIAKRSTTDSAVPSSRIGHAFAAATPSSPTIPPGSTQITRLKILVLRPTVKIRRAHGALRCSRHSCCV